MTTRNSSESPKPFTSDELARLARMLDDPQLQALAEELGKERFNPFQVLAAEEFELRHTRTLCWLLNPAGSHEEGPLFLEAFLASVRVQKRPGNLRDVKAWAEAPVEGGRLRFDREPTVEPEEASDDKGRLDVYLEGLHGQDFALAIEAKIHAEEHGEQLDKYVNAVRERVRDCSNFFYLTREGTPPRRTSHPGLWQPISWVHHVARPMQAVISKVRNDYVRQFVESYLETVREVCEDQTHGPSKLARDLGEKYASTLSLVSRSTNPQVAPELQERLKGLRSALDKIVSVRTRHRRNLIAEFTEFLRSQDYAVAEVRRRKAGASQREFVPNSWWSAGKIPFIRKDRPGFAFSVEARVEKPDFELKLYFPKKDAAQVEALRSRLAAAWDKGAPPGFRVGPNNEKIWRETRWPMSEQGLAEMKKFVIDELPGVARTVEPLL